MTRFEDHWKALLRPTPAAPRPGTGESPDCQPPRAGRYRGAPVWIHPLDPAPADPAFVTDDGQAFEPDDALANVQLERYVPRDTVEARRTALLKKAYYLLKPVMPRGTQLRIQRANARARLRTVKYPAWPQDDSTDRALNAFLARVMQMQGVDRIPFLGFWPAGRRWAACFTHDVETTAGLRAMGGMAGIEEARAIRSTWYVVPERYPVRPGDFAFLRERGHEIGVHGLNHDGRLFSTRAEFSRRVPLINRYLREWGASGFRSPALHRNPDWLPELAIRYDSSYMDTAVLEPQLGGVGMVHPFQLDDRVVELPITMPMDHHLINLLRTDPVEGMLAKFRWVVERSGLANFLYHPDYNLEEERLREYREVVETVAGTAGGWIATAAEVAEWWRRRRESSLEGSASSPCVVGPAAADGSIWHAVLEGDRVRIEPPVGAAA
jgi:hypothetical protein